jgi:uncharacterized membrane protein
MGMDLNVQLYVVTILIIVGIIRFILRKKPNEPESDERTQKVAGKAALNTIVVIMGALAVIGCGYILEIFKLETPAVVSVVFFALMISMLGFLKYYNSKDV